MDYITYKRYKGSGIGGYFNLRHGTKVTENGGFLHAPDGRGICAVTSEDGWEHFRPDTPEGAYRQKLLDKLYRFYISGKGDAVARWREHVALLKSRIAKLNDLHFTSLYYQNSLGTSLNIKLPETHVWAGGDNTCLLYTSPSPRDTR